MTTVDEHVMHAPVEFCLRVAAAVEQWPEILPHYRRVRFLRRDGHAHGRVEMAAWRSFGGPLRYPVWWASEMWTDADEPAVHYRHVAGITRGMIVKWAFQPEGGATRVRITHAWDGPDWPLVGRFAWERVIGPVFVSAIARRTLAGVAAEAERQARDAAGLAANPTDPTTLSTDTSHD